MYQVEILSNTTFKHKDYKYRLLDTSLELKKFIKCEKLLKWFYPISKIVKIKNNFYFVRKFDKITPIPYNNYTISLLENDVIEPYNYYTNKNHIYVYDEEDVCSIIIFEVCFYQNKYIYRNFLNLDSEKYINNVYNYLINKKSLVIEKKNKSNYKIIEYKWHLNYITLMIILKTH